MRSFVFPLSLVAGALLLGGCATAQMYNGPFVPNGGIKGNIGSASYSAHAVRGPRINIARRSDGSWAGELKGQAIDVSVHGDRVVGVNTHMKIEKKPHLLTITGQFNGRMFRFEVTPVHLMARTDTHSRDLPLTGPAGHYSEVTFTGNAVGENRPEPQFAFALLSTFLY